MKTIIFDIDGTLADVEHRRHHLQGKPKRWDKFFAEMDKDPPIMNVVSLCQEFLSHSYSANIVFCSGRGEEHRAVTEAWLLAHVTKGDTLPLLLMRPAKDNRPDDIIKKEMLDQLRAEGHDIWFVVDDRQRVVDMWRANGVTCLQAAPGDFDTADPYYYEPKDGEALLHLMVGPSGAGKSRHLLNLIGSGKIAAESVISSDAVRAEMLGDIRDQSQNDRVFAYIHDTVKTRMRYGLVTYVDATHLHRKDRLAAVANAPDGTVVTYHVIDRQLPDKLRDGGWRLSVVKDGINLVERHHQAFKSARADILRGDGLPNVIVKDHRLN